MRRTTSQPAAGRPPRNRRRVRIAAGVLLAVVASGIVAVVCLRDAPRRIVRNLLSDRLAAEVSLGRLEIRGGRSFVLHDLVVREPAAYPWLASLSIPRLEVEGAPLDMREGRFEAWTVHRPTLTTRVPDRPATVPEEGPAPRIGRVEALDGTWLVEADGSRYRARFAVRVEDVPERNVGTVRIEGGDEPLLALFAFARGMIGAAGADTVPLDVSRPCRGLVLEAAVTENGTVDVDAHAPCSMVPTIGGSGPIPFPVMRATIGAPGEDGTRRIEVRADSRGIARVELALDRASDGGTAWRRVRATIDDIGPALAAAGALPAGVDLSGRGEATLGDGGTGSARLGFRAELDEISWNGPAGRLRLESVTVSGHVDVSGTDPESGGPIDVRAVAGTVRGATVDGLAIPDGDGPWSIGAAGDVRLAPAAGFRGTVELDLGRLGRWDVRADVGGTGEGRLDVRARSAPWDLSAVLAVSDEIGLSPALPRDVVVEGTARFAIRVDGTSQAPTLEGRIDLADGVVLGPDDTGRLETRRLTVNFDRSPSGAFRFACEGEGVAGVVPGLLAMEDAALRVAGTGTAAGSIAVPSSRLEGSLRIADSPARTATFTARLFLDDDGEVRLENGNFEWEDLVGVALEARRDPAGGGTDGSFALTRADVPGLLAWIPSTPTPIPTGPNLAIDPSLEGRFRIVDDGSWTAGGRLGWTGLVVQSEDGARVVQGLDAAWEWRAERAPSGALRAETSGTAGGFVALWDRLFADYGEARPELRLEGGMDGDRWEARAEVSLDRHLRLDLSGAGSTAGGPTRFGGTIDASSLVDTFERWVRGPLAGSVDSLDTLDLGGRADVRLDAIVGPRGEGAVTGTVALDGVEFRVGDAVRVAGLELALPVDVRWSRGIDGTARLTGPARTGRIRFDALDLAGIPVTATTTELEVRGDVIGLRRPLELRVAGGRVGIERLTARDLALEGRRLEAGLTIEGIRLERISEVLGLPPLQGTLEGAFPRVELTPALLHVEGGGTVDVFGGRIRLGDVSGRDILSRFPRLTLSATFDDIDLARVTRVFDFGEMTGIMRGHLRDCELFRGIPVRFDAALQNVPRKGVRQTVTVKAINNLTILGTGGGTSVFDRGIHRFLDRYGYVGLGMTARLADDRFVLRGTERRGDRELFLKGRLPFRLDIVNIRPGQSVSFRSMLDRLSRLDLSAVSTDRPGSDVP